MVALLACDVSKRDLSSAGPTIETYIAPLNDITGMMSSSWVRHVRHCPVKTLAITSKVLQNVGRGPNDAPASAWCMERQSSTNHVPEVR